MGTGVGESERLCTGEVGSGATCVGGAPRTMVRRDVMGALCRASTACLCVKPTSVTSLMASRRSPATKTSTC